MRFDFDTMLERHGKDAIAVDAFILTAVNSNKVLFSALASIGGDSRV